MKFFPIILKKVTTSALSTLLVVTIVFGTFGPGVFTKKAEASDLGGSWALVTKEYTLDAIGFSIINMMLQQMSKSIVSWINSGFQGSPAFVQDFGGFMTGIADRVAGDYIWGSDLNFLCSPFKLDLRLALEIQYKQTRNFAIQNQCTLSGAVGNMEKFLSGDFLQGGWNGWFQLTQKPTNNPYGSMLLASEQFSWKLANSKGQEAKLLDFGKGFLSVKQCKTIDDESGGHQKCNTVTPGAAIESQLNSTLDSGRQRIQVADELNEIIAALFTQIASQALGGVGGLLGMTQSGYGAGSGEYYNNLSAQQPGAVIPESQNPIQLSIDKEKKYRNLQQSIISEIQTAATYKTSTYGDRMCHSGVLTPNLQERLATAQDGFADSNTMLSTLNTLLIQYTKSSDPQAQQAAMQKYIDFQLTNVLHTDNEIQTLEEVTLPDAQSFVDSFIAEINDACSGW